VIFEPVEQITKKILNQYNRHPEGWSVLVDSKGDVLVIGPSSGYRLKLVPLNPREYTGVGVRLGRSKGLREMVKDIPPYGFRPLSRQETRDLLSAIHRRGRPTNERIKKLLEMKPVPTWEIDERRPEAVVTGPLVAHPNLSAISKGQRELEAKLAVEADKLFRRKYPLRARTYG
jgi:hypothetical protein